MPHGGWVWWTELGGGMRVPAVMSFGVDGNVIVSDVAMFGGVFFNPFRISPMHGVWAKSARNRIQSTSYWMVYTPIFDPTNTAGLNNLAGFGRVRAELQSNGPDQMAGVFWLDFLPCASPLACPDPLDPAAAWVPYPTVGAVVPIPVTAVRMKPVAAPLQ
jgi:hypothetical protein